MPNRTRLPRRRTSGQRTGFREWTPKDHAHPGVAEYRQPLPPSRIPCAERVPNSPKLLAEILGWATTQGDSALKAGWERGHSYFCQQFGRIGDSFELLVREPWFSSVFPCPSNLDCLSPRPAIEIQGLLIAFSARFRPIFATFRQRIGLFDPLFDVILAPGDPFLAGFSMPIRHQAGPKDGGIPSPVEKSVFAGRLPSDLL
jgi:hypothetical protein